MEWNTETLQFLNTLSPHAEPAVDEQIRHSATVNFKNHLKAHWAQIPDPEKDQIKGFIVTLMIDSTPKIQSHLGEALTVIGQHDFPNNWTTLLLELVVKLDRFCTANDYVSVSGVLSIVNLLFKKFRCRFKRTDLLFDLRYCVENFAKPFLDLFQTTAGVIDQMVASGGVDGGCLKAYVESQRLCCRIFYSLNFMELPEFFQDYINEWMVEFKKCLTGKISVLEDGDSEGLAIVDGLRAAVCENISLYIKEEELFQTYLGGFIEAVWSLLLVASASNERERLTVTAIKFLTTVSTSAHHSLFARDDILQQIVQSIILPNVILRDEDEELFEMNFVEFIRIDMEGSDLYTRRRIACQLLQGIATQYKEKVTEKISAQIQHCLGLFAANPTENWKYKDCAIYHIVSLATKRAEGTSVSTDLVEVENFFRTVIVPELQSQDVNAFPMLKAGALKFFTMFRDQIPKNITMSLLPDVIRFLAADSNVVHSYAASCIEKLLLVKDDLSNARYTSADLSPVLLMLMTNLFAALQKTKSEENQYVMKCIMRVLMAADITKDVALPCISGLATVFQRVCQNPQDPIFNHYLFESVAVLIRRGTEKDPSLYLILKHSFFLSSKRSWPKKYLLSSTLILSSFLLSLLS